MGSSIVSYVTCIKIGEHSMNKEQGMAVDFYLFYKMSKIVHKNKNSWETQTIYYNQ